VGAGLPDKNKILPRKIPSSARHRENKVEHIVGEGLFALDSLAPSASQIQLKIGSLGILGF
jgi:hypothetical protein